MRIFAKAQEVQTQKLQYAVCVPLINFFLFFSSANWYEQRVLRGSGVDLCQLDARLCILSRTEARQRRTGVMNLKLNW